MSWEQKLALHVQREEIGEFIGTTRENVTRTISQFKSEHLINFRGSTLLIQNRSGLENIISA